MNIFLKVMATLLVLTLITGIITAFVKIATANYFLNASIVTSGVVVISIALIVSGLVYGIKKLWAPVVVIGLCLIAGACNYAKSNQQVLISNDCGMNWKQIRAGDAVPKGIGNYCFMKVVIPNYPMQGQAEFVANFKAKVRVKINIDYDYSIINGLAFMKQAKRIGSANADADSNEALNDAAFESAENSVIDVRIRDAFKAFALQEDIVDLDQAELEDRLLEKVNTILSPLGVHLNFITLTVDPDEQTRQAIDVATAMRIYQARGITDVGKQVMTAKAGATKVIVSNVDSKTKDVKPEE